MKKIISIVMLVAGIYMGYLGIKKLDDSSSSIKLGALKLSTSDTEGQTKAYVYLGVSVILLLGGVYGLKGRR